MTRPSFCFPVEPPEQGGGGFRFLRMFEAWLRHRGHLVTRSPRDGADVLFLNSWQTGVWTILRAHMANPSTMVVHRIDNAAANYGRRDGADRRLRLANRFADLTIYQSWYARSVTHPSVVRRDGPVIYNPVDVTAFTPEGPGRVGPDWPLRWPGPAVAVVSWSTNAMKGAQDAYRVARHNPGVLFVFCGRFPDMPALPNTLGLGVLTTTGLGAALRSCDALLTYSRNEACPNHVLEAMACGLPVLYYPTGAMAEVVGDCGHPISLDGSDLGAALALLPRRDYARERIMRRHHPDLIFTRYLREIQARLGPPLVMRHGRTHDLRMASDHA